MSGHHGRLITMKYKATRNVPNQGVGRWRKARKEWGRGLQEEKENGNNAVGSHFRRISRRGQSTMTSTVRRSKRSIDGRSHGPTI